MWSRDDGGMGECIPGTAGDMVRQLWFCIGQECNDFARATWMDESECARVDTHIITGKAAPVMHRFDIKTDFITRINSKSSSWTVHSHPFVRLEKRRLT